MIAVFYDRKNRREVRSNQLVSTRFVRSLVVCDEDDLVPTGRHYDPLLHEPLTREQVAEAVATSHERWTEETLNEWEKWKPELTPRAPQASEELIGNLCYKSPDCSSYQNWDLSLKDEDLIFLRMEDENPETEKWRRQ